ncbi:MAG TPA: SUMF1/EgtB/PvdO family nonheme iron enzyme, partial [Chthoniobacteraceae bacterium]|jgi:formylglycine-generating enzyme required for sulfatase activity
MQFVPDGTIGVLFSKWDTRVKDFETYVAETHEEPGKPVYSLGKEPGADGLYSTDHGDTWRRPGFAQTLNDPVIGVSWSEANAFCAWLSKKEGRTYRLPTDDEWNRAVGSAKYPWGKSWPPKAVDGNFASEEAKDGNWPDDYRLVPGLRDGHGRTSPVGSYHANAWGLYDMGGNVWQWCADAHGPDGDPSERLMRGASWSSYDEATLHSNYRGHGSINYRATNLGFRCVLVASGGK